MIEDHESLEVQIENAWVELCESHRPIAFYLSPRGRLIRGIDRGARSMSNTEIGTYTRSVRLEQFREDVFFVYEETRRAHG